jgi:hypothetical protein
MLLIVKDALINNRNAAVFLKSGHLPNCSKLHPSNITKCSVKTSGLFTDQKRKNEKEGIGYQRFHIGEVEA